MKKNATGIYKTICVTALGAFVAMAVCPCWAVSDNMFARFKTQQEILEYGFNALREGRRQEAFNAFKYGALNNHLASEWKLARMLQAGVGGVEDHVGAYRLFEKIALRYYKKRPKINDRPYVANAVLSLGDYSMNGIENSQIKPDPHMAEFYYFRAAALYENLEAQFKLAQLYASERLGTQRMQSAMRWYQLACQRGHAMAQTELGDLLFYGRAGQKNRIKGLAYLAYSAQNSDCVRCKKRYNLAFEKANPSQRRIALQMAQNLHFARH